MPTTRYIDDNLSFLPSQQWTQQAQSFPGLNSTIPSGIFLYGGTGSSHASSSESEFSTPETFQESSNSPIRSPDTTTIEDVVGGPYLQLVEPPVESCRFRYPTEMKGTHGSILGISTLKKENARKKIFPSVKLHNYHPSPDKKVIIRCSLTTADEDENARFPHVHQLKGKGRTSSSQCKAVEIDDPIDIMVSSPNYQAVFGNMTILYIKKDDQLYELVKKKKRHMQKMYPCNKLIFTEIEDKKLLDEAKEDISQMNLSRLNTARLKFEALELGQGQIHYKELCPPIYSNPIKNIKNTQFSDLRICRIDKVAGSCLGKEEVFIFVEKVNKKDIKVRFFELNENEEEIWEAYAEFQSEEDVHYQYAIAFRTPRYKDVEITENVKVYFELVRPTNNSRSTPKEFEYTPNPDRWQGEIRKRPRCESPTIPTTVGSLSRPSTSQSWNFGRPNLTNELNPPDLQSSSAGSCSTEDEYSILEEFLKDLVPESPQTLFDYSVMMEVDQERLASSTSSHSSVSEVLSSFPSGDSDFIRQTMTSDAIKKLGDCYGATGQTVQELLSLITKPDDEYHTDGVSCRTVVQPESSLTAKHQMSATPEMERTSIHIGSMFTVEPQMSVAKPEMDFRTPIRFQSDSNNQDKLDNRISGRLTRENVVSKVDKALNVLLGRRNRIQEKGMKRILQAIFTKEVGGNDDRVLHIMASNPNFSPLMLKFLNVLKMYDITERVVDLKNNRGQTPLHLAAEKGSLQTIALLVDTGANVNIRDISLNTPLHLVANREQNDAFHAVGHIIERNPDLTIYNEDGLTPLHLFVLKRKSDVISSLIVKSEDRSMEDDLINQQDRKQGNTALHMAVQKKYLEIVNLLLNFEDRIDVNARNFDDKTPLAYVSGETVEDIKMQDLLLANKADPLLVHSRKVKSKESDELKNEFDHHEDDDEEFEEVDETLPSYAQDWKSEAELKLMDTQTICSVCPVLDESNSWKKLFQKLDFEEDLLQYLELKWSPTLYLLKTVAETMPHISPEMLRDILIRINPECKKAAQFIDDMILCKMGVF